MTLLNHLFLFIYILYALCLSVYIMPMFCMAAMATDYINYFQLFHFNWNNWYNSTTRVCIRRTCIQCQSQQYAENRSKTRAYQTVSCDTTKAPLSIPGSLIMTMSKRWLPWNVLAGNGLQPLCLVWPSTKQLNRAIRPLRLAESCNPNVLRRAVTWKIYI